MKKVYQAPEIMLDSLAPEETIAASYGEKFNPEGNGVDLGNNVETTDATSGNLSRRNVWDDED